MNNLKAVFFCLLSVLVLFSSTNTVLADEIDDLLDKCAVAPDPKPSVMVYDYELSPETLMPGDMGVLTITLKNTQEEPIEKDIKIDEPIQKNNKTNKLIVDTETRFTLDAYIKEAYVVENDFKVYNKYVSAGVIGPGRKVDFTFKIKAPAEEGIYMLKFIADIEDMEGKSSKGIRYFIPIIVAGTLNILPLEVSQNEFRLEIINEGLSDVASVYIMVSNASGIEFDSEEIWIGKIKSGESATAVFKVIKTEDGENTAVFKAVYKNGVNKHESNQVCVRIPCSPEEEKGESLLEGESETSFSALIVTPTDTYPSSLTSASKLPVFGAVFAFAGLLVPGILYLFLSKRKRGGKGEGKDMRGEEE